MARDSGGGDGAGAADESPSLEERGGGDVEGGVGEGGQRPSAREKLEHARLDLNGVVSGVRVDVGQRAGRAVDAEESLETVDFVERLLSGGAESGWVGSVQGDFEARRHGVARDHHGWGDQRHVDIWVGEAISGEKETMESSLKSAWGGRLIRRVRVGACWGQRARDAGGLPGTCDGFPQGNPPPENSDTRRSIGDRMPYGPRGRCAWSNCALCWWL